jgi:serine/threonine protein phosphatase PrpC
MLYCVISIDFLLFFFSFCRKMMRRFQYQSYEMQQKGKKYPVAHVRGRRRTQEDVLGVYMIYIAGTGCLMYIVGDGHGGSDVAKLCDEKLPQFIMEIAASKNIPPDAPAREYKALLTQAIFEAFDKMQALVLSMEYEIAQQGTCVTGCILTPHGIVTLNLGDSVVCLYNEKGLIIKKTDEHKPDVPGEMERIKKEGGNVIYVRGVARVNGILAVSRAIGDANIENISHVPDIDWVSPENSALVKAIVVCCDGYSEISDDYRRPFDSLILCTNIGRQYTNISAVEMVEKATDESIRIRGSCDNHTMIIIDVNASIEPTTAPSIAATTDEAASSLVVYSVSIPTPEQLVDKSDSVPTTEPIAAATACPSVASAAAASTSVAIVCQPVDKSESVPAPEPPDASVAAAATTCPPVAESDGTAPTKPLAATTECPTIAESDDNTSDETEPKRLKSDSSSNLS